MKQNIIKIEQLAAMLFAETSYNKFIQYINTDQINAARLMLDIEVEKLDSLDTDIDTHFEHNIAMQLQDLLMDLIINEMDGEREGKQVSENTG